MVRGRKAQRLLQLPGLPAGGIGAHVTECGNISLALELKEILGAIQLQRQVVGAARTLGCSPSYVHARLKEKGMTLGELLEGGEPIESPLDWAERTELGSG